MRRLAITVLLPLALLVGACSTLPATAPPAAGIDSTLIAGNHVRLLFDGPQTMAAMETALRGARHSIHLETYVFDQDAVGLRFAGLLMQRQRAGVQVRIIYDAVGTLRTPQAFFDDLRDAGVELLAFHPVNPLRLHGPWLPNNRDHRKILVVDGRIGFTGGVNISASYSNSSLFRARPHKGDAPGWRDTHLQIEGPAVAVLQAVFLQTWNTGRDTPLADAALFPPLPAAGATAVRVVASEPDGRQEVRDAYLRAIAAAQRRIDFTCAYFVPDAALLDALLAAARRGVAVRIILPAVPEGGLVFEAGRSFFETLLQGGIHLHLMREVVLHAKTAVIDGHWSTVGSSNLDTRSFLLNSEINVIVIDDAFGAAMEAAFAEDLAHSDELLLADWRRRSPLQRLREWAARRLAWWL